MNRLCIHCGAENSGSANFCKRCGSSLALESKIPETLIDTKKKRCTTCWSKYDAELSKCPKCFKPAVAANPAVSLPKTYSRLSKNTQLIVFLAVAGVVAICLISWNLYTTKKLNDERSENLQLSSNSDTTTQITSVSSNQTYEEPTTTYESSSQASPYESFETSNNYSESSPTVEQPTNEYVEPAQPSPISSQYEYFVILGCYNSRAKSLAEKRLSKVQNAGYSDAWLVFSNDHPPMRSNLWVVVMGPYSSHIEAQSVSNMLKSTVSDSYIKKTYATAECGC